MTFVMSLELVIHASAWLVLRYNSSWLYGKRVRYHGVFITSMASSNCAVAIVIVIALYIWKKELNSIFKVYSRWILVYISLRKTYITFGYVHSHGLTPLDERKLAGVVKKFCNTLTAILWDQHGVHQGPREPRWGPCWPHEPCYLGRMIYTELFRALSSTITF